MALLGNIIWFVLCGWWNFILYGFLGCVCCITIIGIPIGKALFQYAKLMTFPFGKVIVKETDIKGKENVAAVRRAGGVIANILWLPVGVIGFILNIGLMIACAVTIVGIPAAIVLAKSCTFLLWPVGARVITKQEAETLRMEQSMMKVMGTAMAVGSMTAQGGASGRPGQSLESGQYAGGGESAGGGLVDAIPTDEITEWVRANWEYIAAGIGILCMFLFRRLPCLGALVISLAAYGGIMKRNHIFVYVVSGLGAVLWLIWLIVVL